MRRVPVTGFLLVTSGLLSLIGSLVLGPGFGWPAVARGGVRGRPRVVPSA